MLDLRWRILIWLAILFAIAATQPNGAYAMAEGIGTYLLIIFPWFLAQPREDRVRVKRIKVRDPHGLLAARMGVSWMWHRRRPILVVEVAGTRRQVREFRERLERIANGEDEHLR